MIHKRYALCAWLVAAGLTAIPTPAWAQFGEDWAIFEDPETDEACGVVNAANAELTVVDRTGEVILITGRDTLLGRLFVDDNNDVFYDGFAAGAIVFADDADDFPTVFWITDRGTVVDLDVGTGEPFDSGLFPEEIGFTVCDPCDLVDSDPFCDDGGFGGGGGGSVGIIGCGVGALPAMMLTAVGLPFVGRSYRRSR